MGKVSNINFITTVKPSVTSHSYIINMAKIHCSPLLPKTFTIASWYLYNEQFQVRLLLPVTFCHIAIYQDFVSYRNQ